ncbi:MAG: glycoside hydrolase family 2 TIM barrel-domain containing protein, partial [Bacteroidota bacterium]
AQHRTTGTYTKRFVVEEAWRGKRVFIHFEGSNITTKVTLNGQEVGNHRGGYAAFSFELTPYLRFEEDNELRVEVSNELDLAVIPLVGDFNNYGGIYRPVRLMITEKVLCISPLDYASPGIYIKQSDVSDQSARVEVMTKYLSMDKALVQYRTTILDAEDQAIATQTSEQATSMDDSGTFSHTYDIPDPHLWRGKEDPYLYRVKVDLLHQGEVVDSKTEHFGLRYFSIDPNEGFSLNGQSLPLRGVSRHHDKIDKGSALSDADHRQDMDLMLEMGINTLRLAHYQHAEKVYDMADSAGVVVWAEIPFIGLPEIVARITNGYEPTDEFHANARQQLLELIRQNYNHPSIVFWSIYNELQNPEDASPVEFLKELNALAKAEDPGRLTVAAGMLSADEHPDMQSITDVFAYNRYFGWYYGEPGDMADFLDDTHANYPDLAIGISEYGAGGSIYQHANELERPNPIGSPHPEEWQSYYHEEHLKIFDERPFVWGTFVWNMFDFSSHQRREGDQQGRNDKGMVTFDRKTRKDAFFYYKANWTEDPVLHITSRRYVFREEPSTWVKVYSNLPSVSLTVNGEELGTKSPEKGMVVWPDVTLTDGANTVGVKAVAGEKEMVDEVVWMYEHPYKGANMAIKLFDWVVVAWYWVFGGLLLVFLTWFYGIRKSKARPTWQRVLAWIVLVILILIVVAMVALKILLSQVPG